MSNIFAIILHVRKWKGRMPEREVSCTLDRGWMLSQVMIRIAITKRKNHVNKRKNPLNQVKEKIEKIVWAG